MPNEQSSDVVFFIHPTSHFSKVTAANDENPSEVLMLIMMMMLGDILNVDPSQCYTLAHILE